ncbi:Putative polyhydroxyalkanoic acid system protein (PHA_gran_rgn) [Loktanella sp. DSM 29012]|uniref:Polyhydroxyalkanoic acid system family protein n=1 Tax=Loktanella gaetbuli TaxID=2881335 RepID=A0ABS8BYE4_9RHOB|nr:MULTISPECIES: polyhydroxyalkanoic acid system family protein [Loktanella]KQI67513.1 hypothetical protein AN189_15380 [Loktanella sp. 3ANDIMAR09]MCB5200753.1 polyhydroxyalkanoic acid system family protein [Loktanella gaetbuli]SEQ81099.1 Putative polyhydroxyalkanoic acid system protein (PHA_gran_rgn) [Loktanella sp. DSM 29012]
MPSVDFNVPHALPKEDAAARLLAGIPKLEKAIPGGGDVQAERVGDDGMILSIKAMGQTITVDSVLSDSAVSGQVKVPLMLAMMQTQIRDMVQDSVTRMLAKPA